MAETLSKYQDSLISQETLDLLMKEAETLGPEAFEVPVGGTVSSAGEENHGFDIIDQSEIDALLGLGPIKEEKKPEEVDLVSQDDIDALFAAKPSKKKKTEVPLIEPFSEFTAVDSSDAGDEFSDLDFVSMEDIEALMKSVPLEEDEIKEEPQKSSLEDTGMISQDDIDALLRVSQDIQPPPEKVRDVHETGETLISQDDIDALLSGSMGRDPFTGESGKINEPDLDDKLISQDDIDKLLAGTEPLPETFTTAGIVSRKENEKNLISQEDIDKLLMGQPEEQDEPETMIDQDDIDRLLSSAKPVSASKPERVQPDKLISQEDIDRLLNEDTAERALLSEKRVLDQVIIEEREPVENEEPENEQQTEPQEKPAVKKNAVIRVLAACIVVVLLAGSFVIVQKKLKIMHKKNTEIAGKQIPAETSKVSGKDANTLKTYKVSMRDFVVISPDSIKGMSYVALDLTVEITSVPVNPLKDSEPLFRNVVYEAISKAIASQGESKLGSDDLKKILKDALKTALPHGSVSKVEISDFRTG